MNAISRRKFFGTAASIAATQCLSANPLGLPMGSQTYPHRQRIKDGDFAGLCKDMADLGIQNVELCSPSYAEFASLSDGKQVRRILDDHGLKCPSSHFNMSALRTKQPEMIAWAKDIGVTQPGRSNAEWRYNHGCGEEGGRRVQQHCRRGGQGRSSAVSPR
jgi:sugar phosphate isomerase/epimerase